MGQKHSTNPQNKKSAYLKKKQQPKPDTFFTLQYDEQIKKDNYISNWLIKQKMEINCHDKYGYSILHFICRNPNASGELIEWLIVQGAPVNRLPVDNNLSNFYSETILELVLRNEKIMGGLTQLSTIKTLLQSEQELDSELLYKTLLKNITENKNIWLQAAIETAHWPLVIGLLIVGVELNNETIQRTGQATLFLNLQQCIKQLSLAKDQKITIVDEFFKNLSTIQTGTTTIIEKLNPIDFRFFTTPKEQKSTLNFLLCLRELRKNWPLPTPVPKPVIFEIIKKILGDHSYIKSCNAVEETTKNTFHG